MSFKTYKVIILLMFLGLVACSSQEAIKPEAAPRSNPGPVSPSPGPTPSPIDPTPAISPPTAVKAGFISSGTASISWAENYQILDPEVFVNIQVCNSSVCSEDSYSTIAFSDSSSIIIADLSPSSDYSIRVRAEKGLDSSSWVNLPHIRTFDSPIVFGINSSNEDILLRAGEFSTILTDENGVDSTISEIIGNLALAGGYTYQHNNSDKFISFSKKVLYTGINPLIPTEKRLILASPDSVQGDVVLGDYDISGKSIVDASESTSIFFSGFYFIADSIGGDQNLVYSAPMNSLFEITAEPILNVNASELEEYFGSLYVIAPSLLDPTLDSLYLLDQNKSLSVLYTAGPDKRLKNLTKSEDGFSLFLTEDSVGAGTFKLLKFDPFSSSIEFIDSEIQEFSLAYGLKFGKNGFHAQSSINPNDKLVFRSIDSRRVFNTSSIFEPNISFNSFVTVENINGDYKLSSFFLEKNLEALVTVKSTSIRSVLYSGESRKEAPFFVNGEDVYFISINNEGNRVLSKANIRSLDITTDISLENEQVSNAGLAFAGNKLFYITESNKVVSYSLLTNSNSIEQDTQGGSVNPIVSGIGIGLNNENWFFYEKNGAFLAGVIPSDPAKKETAVYLIDTTGRVLPLFGIGADNLINFNKINVIF
jgi:hypothetical protein